MDHVNKASFFPILFYLFHTFIKVISFKKSAFKPNWDFKHKLEVQKSRNYTSTFKNSF